MIVLFALIFHACFLVGQLNTKSNVLNSIYHVTFRVYKIFKGKLPTKQHYHVRLVFQMEHPSSSSSSVRVSKWTKRSTRTNSSANYGESLTWKDLSFDKVIFCKQSTRFWPKHSCQLSGGHPFTGKLLRKRDKIKRCKVTHHFIINDDWQNFYTAQR